MDVYRQWVAEVDRYVCGDITKILIANKSDLGDKRSVTIDAGKQLAAELGRSA